MFRSRGWPGDFYGWGLETRPRDDEKGTESCGGRRGSASLRIRIHPFSLCPFLPSHGLGSARIRADNVTARDISFRGPFQILKFFYSLLFFGFAHTPAWERGSARLSCDAMCLQLTMQPWRT